ncbi:MAG TPA: cupin domain-containing protein [Solirubrobacteraceae bacterium]|nr:cupin domain-containing protein [Solirubrobacteraceae bacterium]
MVIHCDDVPWEARECGPLAHERARLGGLAGALGVGLSRYRVPAGGQMMPAHTHADEEETAFVTGGGGLLWEDGATVAVGAGDTVVHRRGAGPHTLVAGENGLEVLIFAEGSPTELTWLPRAGVMVNRLCPLPSDTGDPWEREAAAGPLDLSSPAPRPDHVQALDDVEAWRWGRGLVRVRRRDLGRAAGAVHSGLRELAVAPGARSSPRHCHSAEEELFVVLAGAGELVLGDERAPVRTGSVVARPAGTGVAHAFEAGDEELLLLAYGTRRPEDLAWYPDSRKIALRGLGVFTRVEPVGYWDGEDGV